MCKCCVCGEFIDIEAGEQLIYDEDSGKPAHKECLISLDGFEIYRSLAAENNKVFQW